MKIKCPSKVIDNICKKITRNDVLAIIVVFILGIVNNFNFITTEGIAPDALSTGDFNIAGNWEVSLGRFGIRLVNLMRFGLVNKFIIILICLLFLAGSVIFITRTFKIKNKIVVFLVASLVSVAPQFTETYMFIYCADAYTLAFLISTLTVFFLSKSETNKFYYLYACICTIVVCSLYQAYLGVIIGLTILLLIYHLVNNMSIKDVLVRSVKYILSIAAGVWIYYLILKIILFLLGISLSAYKGANSLGIDTIKSLPKTIIQTYKDFYYFFFTNKVINNTYWGREKINSILFVASIIGLVCVVLKNKYDNKTLRVLLMIILLGIFPIGISIMDLIAPTTRINLVTGPGLIISIIIIVLIYKKLNNTSFENVLKYLYIVMLLLLIYTFILENTYTYMCRQQTHMNYYTISNDIYNKATELEGFSNEKKWMFSDVIKFDIIEMNKSNGFISNDNETWNNYNGTLQNYNYFEKYLGIKIKICSREEYKKIIETQEFKEMPTYPQKGSVQIINNVVVIKVSEKTL